MDRDKDYGIENKAKGIGRQIEGKTNEVVGAIQGDTSQELKGKVQKNLGKGQEKLGDLQNDIDTGSDVDKRDRDLV